MSEGARYYFFLQKSETFFLELHNEQTNAMNVLFIYNQRCNTTTTKITMGESDDDQRRKNQTPTTDIK